MIYMNKRKKEFIYHSGKRVSDVFGSVVKLRREKGVGCVDWLLIRILNM